jgi:hypothetical protein
LPHRAAEQALTVYEYNQGVGIKMRYTSNRHIYRFLFLLFIFEEDPCITQSCSALLCR